MCPSKVKKFLWRTLRGTLPCRVILANCHIKVTPQCLTCGRGAEDVRHLLFQCQKVKVVWKILGVDELIQRARTTDRAGEAILGFLMHQADQDCRVLGVSNTRELIAVGAWVLWWERRRLVHEEKTQTVSQIALSV
jgi:hypothetical protein